MKLRRIILVASLLVALVVVPTLLSAQSTDVPKYTIFGGFSYYHPGGNANTGGSEPFVRPSYQPGDGTVAVTDLKKGWAGQFTYNLNHWAGITADVNGHYGDYSTAYSMAAGPQFRLRTSLVQPFAEALLGWQRIGPKYYPNQDTFAFWVGGGLDYPVGRRFSIRLIQADYVNSYYNKLSPSGTNNDFNGLRLQTGLLYNFGLPKVVNYNASAACSAEPAAVDAGVPVKILVTAAGFNPKHKLTYTYSSNAATKIAAMDGVATVETTGLAPGMYKVNGMVSDDAKAPHQATASCSASFTVNQPPMHPPVLSVSARPSSVVAGDASVITAMGSSPDNRPLSYNCTANAGRLTGSGTGYTLDTAGVGAGTVTIHCTVSDDRNLTATASTTVSVSVPPPAPVAREFGKIMFEHDAKRPARVDNEAKGELDRYADALAADPNAQGYVVGYETEQEAAAHKGKKTPSLAAERAVNTKDYLVHEKGVDAKRITPMTGTGISEKTTDLWVVPAGATFPAAGTMAVDESKVKAAPRVAPAPVKKTPAKKAAAKK